MQKDEIDLILKVQQWDLDSFTPLYEKYFQKIYSFALIKAEWNISLAEDVTATTFMKAFENIEKFSVEWNNGSFAARLYKISINSFLDFTRKKESDRLEDENIATKDSNYLDYFQNHVQAEQILAYLDELWSEKRDLFVLRIWDELPYEDISKILWKRSSTCRKDFSKLVKKIANHFKYWIDD